MSTTYLFYKLSVNAQQLERFLEDAEGDITGHEEEILKWMESIADRQNELFDDSCDLHNHFAALAKAQKEEADRIMELAKANENKAKKIKEALFAYMTTNNIRKGETTRHKLSIAGNGGKAPLVFADELFDDSGKMNAEKLPEYLRAIQYVPNMVEIRSLAETMPDFAGTKVLRDEDGNEIARILPRGEHLRMK